MKKIKFLALIVLLLCCTACGNKKAIKGYEFYNKLSSDYEVEDILEYYDFAENAYRAKGNEKLKVLYVDTNKTNAQSIFIDETKNIYAEASSDLIEQHKNDKSYELKEEDLDKTIITGDNYSIIDLTTSKTYYRIVWIQDTIMIGSVNVSEKTTLLKLMRGLGY